jgi:ATP-dependent Clp protease ATP-binding subunit ClpB
MRMDQFTVKAQEAIAEAQTAAERSDHPEVTPEHVLQALVSQEAGVVPAALGKMGANTGAIAQEVDKALGALPHTQGAATQLSPRLDAVFKAALKAAESLKDDYISTEHLLIALAESKTPAGEILKRHGVTRDGILTVLRDIRGNQRVTDPNAEERYQSLEKYGRDLTEIARKGKLDPVIGRDEEVRRVMQVLSRRTKNNPVLIGEPGVGKTAIVEGLAQRIVSGDVPDRSRTRGSSPSTSERSSRAQIPRRVRGPPQGRPQGGHGVGGEIILFIDELHTVVGAARPRGPWTPRTCSSPCWPAASCAASAPPP